MKIGDRVRVIVGTQDYVLQPHLIGRLGTITGVPSFHSDRPEWGKAFLVQIDAGCVWALRECTLELVSPARQRVSVPWLIEYWIMAIVALFVGLVTLRLTLDFLISLGACLFVWALYGCYQLYQAVRKKEE